MVSRPLHGIRIVDLSRFVAGSYSTLVLSALGAEVLKIEIPPAGDPYRDQGVARVGDESALFMTLNSGKKSVALDFRSSETEGAVDALLDSADVVVENARPGSLARYGLDYDSVHERHPRIVYGSISGFGDIGPEAQRGGFDLILQAVGGLMSVTGHPDTGPAKVGAPVTDVGAGLACAVGILGALIESGATGEGSHVSTSLLEFSLSSLATLATARMVGGGVPGLLGAHSPTFAPYGAFRARDGWLVLAGAGSEDLWRRCCRSIGAEPLLDNPRFVDNASRVENRDALTQEIEAVIGSRDVEYWIQRLSADGIPAGRINDLDRAFSGPQVEALGTVQKLEHPTAGPYPLVSVPIRMNLASLQIQSPAPRLGEHTRSVLLELGFDESAIDALVESGSALVLS
jgi:crotonobetainyl-CoA:carnitine CoA-transferase CaiB-like acyl-CoA transferase